jgi:hypothetical protein
MGKHSLMQQVRRRFVIAAAQWALAFSWAAWVSAQEAGLPPWPDISRQTADEVERTLADLKQIDDLPLFTMTYYGDYDPLAGGDFPSQAADQSRWGCSLFYAGGGSPIFGRNFDWQRHPALLLFTRPNGRYASVSMVDIGYLGFDLDHLDLLDDAANRRPLLSAPLMPFDGMNEQGLAIGMAAVAPSQVPEDSKRPTVHGLQLMRLMLDHARDVDEALEWIPKFNVTFVGGPHLHFLLADRAGHSALVEYRDNDVHVLRGAEAWHAATNFYVCGNEAPATEMCQRYRELHRQLSQSGGRLNVEESLDLLKRIAQNHTRWSVVYELEHGRLHLAWVRDFAHVRQFTLSPATAQPTANKP